MKSVSMSENQENSELEKPLSKALPWIMWGFGALFYCYQFIIRVCPSVMADDWMETFAIDAVSLGFIAAFYYQAYAAMQIPLGLLIDKLGPRRLLSLAALGCATGCFLTALTSYVQVISIARFLMGMGAAAGFLGSLKLATLWFPPKKIAMIAGLTTGLGTIGGISGQAPLSLLNGLIHWQGSMYVLTAIGLTLSVVIWVFVADSPSEVKKTKKKKTTENIPIFKGLQLVLKNKQCWIVALHGLLMYVPLSAFADLWGIPFLKSAYGFREEYAATMVSSIYLGTIVGGLLLGPVTAYFGREKIPMMLGALVSGTCYAVVIFVHPLPDGLIYALLFMGGVAFITECLCFSLSLYQLPVNYGGIAVGFTNMIIMLSGVLMQPLIGWLIKLASPPQSSIEEYTLNTFQNALWIVPFCLFIAFALVFFIKDQKQAQKRPNTISQK